MDWRHVDGSLCDMGRPMSLLDQGWWCAPHQKWFLISGAPDTGVVPLPSGSKERPGFRQAR